MKTKKIIFFHTIYEIGGISSVVKNLMESFAEENFDLVLLTEKLSESRYPLNSSIKIKNLDICSKKGFFKKCVNILRHIKSIRRIIISESPDAVISFGAPANCYLLTAVLFMRHSPRIVIVEQSEEIFSDKKTASIKYFLYKTLMFLLYRRADYVVSVSQAIAGHFKRMHMARADKTKVINNPINISRCEQLCGESRPALKKENNVLYVGTVSRLSNEKGIGFLIDGFKILSDRVNARLIIVGDGPQRKMLEQKAAGLKINEKVIFTGFAPNPFEYLKSMDIFVLPSLWEGFSNVILEAMSCRVPVIAADSGGGVREAVINNVNGLLIEPKSPHAIADSIYYLVSNKGVKEAMVKEAYDSVRKFDIHSIKEQYKNLILN